MFLVSITLEPWSSQHQVDVIGPVADKSPPPATPVSSDTFKKIITSLLNILIVPYAREETDNIGSSSSDKQAATEKKTVNMVETPSEPSLPSNHATLEGLLATGSSSDTSVDLELKADTAGNNRMLCLRLNVCLFGFSYWVETNVM